jgi:hypothetical protein
VICAPSPYDNSVTITRSYAVIIFVTQTTTRTAAAIIAAVTAATTPADRYNRN